MLMSYMIGVMNIHAMAMMPRMCSRSRKYTSTALMIIVMPRARIYSIIMTTGRHSSPGRLNCTPENSATINTTISQYSMFTKALVT